MQRRVLAVFKMNGSVDDVGVSAGGGAVEGPLEAAEADRQASQRDVDVRARILETAGLFAAGRCHLGEQVGLVEVEGLAQLKNESAILGRVLLQAEAEASGRVTGELLS